jgi:hypothetical protein
MAVNGSGGPYIGDGHVHIQSHTSLRSTSSVTINNTTASTVPEVSPSPSSSSSSSPSVWTPYDAAAPSVAVWNARTAAANGNNQTITNGNATATSTATTSSEQSLLERNTRLSHSFIWQWMRSFYEGHGVTAWSQGIVPNFVTTNCAIAQVL